jgi:SNF2 family DNA or RNA helicase
MTRTWQTRNTDVIADVRLSDDMERVVLSPRRSADGHKLAQTLRASMCEVTFRRTPEGFSLPALHSGTLLRCAAPPAVHWTEEALRVAQNRVGARRRAVHVLEQVSRLKTGGPSLAGVYLKGLSGLDALDEHQLVNVAAMTVPDSHGLCVFDEQGAGKTVTLIHAFDVLVARDEADFALIVAPKSMIAEWPLDFERFKGDLYKVAIATGSRAKKLCTLQKAVDVIVTNFETASSMEPELRAMLRAHSGRAVLVVDESFYVKNLDAKRTRALRRLREFCGRAYVLCGTPAPNSPHDIIQQFNLVDFGLTFAGVEIPEDRQLATEIVQRVIEQKGAFVRHQKKDVLPELHPKRFNRVLVHMAPAQQRFYEAALHNLVADVRTCDQEYFQRNLTSFLSRRNALLQICSNPTGVVEGYREIPAKLRALDELITDIVTVRGEKLVVWSFYRASLEQIVNRYSRFNPVRYDGSVTDVTVRREAVRRFQEDNETMLFVGNPAAAGAGLTLHRACVAVYESMSNQAAHYLQSVDRIHRRGQCRAVEYVVLLCAGTIELAEYQRLTAKERAAQELLGDPTEARVTRDTFLEDLLPGQPMLS